ncbi:MAG: DUF4838 domain-containing protein [Lentisphaeria bacterium]|nr:DUF4838 domain-containing protein [Lentisphaeria bacterium]
MKHFSLLFTLFLFSAAFIAKAETKIADCIIAIPVKHTAVEKYAAAKLAYYLQKITGKKLTVIPESKVSLRKAIYVGHTDFGRQNNIDYKKLGREEWVIRTVNDSLILTGGFNRGIVYAVYDYLERHAKVRNYDENTVIIPSNPELTAGTWNLQRKPSFDSRWIYDCLDWGQKSHSFKEFNKLFSYTQKATGMHKMIGGERPHHTAYDYMKHWPVDKKELYALQSDGSRPIPKNPVGPGQMCLTNPEVRRLVIAQLRKFIERDRKEAKAGNYPPPVFYDISHNDNYHKCVCKNCMTIAEREGSYSGTLIDFINFIARDIAQDYPDVIIRTFAYTYTAAPPKNIKTEKNVSMHLAFLGAEMGGEYYYYDSMRPLSHKLNSEVNERNSKWSKFTDYICRWEYWRLYPGIPEANLRIGSVAEDLKRNYECNVRYIFAEYESPHWNSFFALHRYIGAKLLDDLNCNAAELQAEFMQNYYGAAAEKMTELLNYMQKRQDQFQYRIGEIAPDRRSYKDEEYFRTAFKLLKEAEKAAANNSLHLTHVRLEKAPLIGSLLYRRPYLKNFTKEYDFKKLTDELRKESTAAINYFYDGRDSQKKSAESGLSSVLKSIETYNYSAELPANFKVEGNNFAVLTALHFAQNKKGKLVDDSSAFRQKAMKIPFAKNNSLKIIINNWMEPGEITIPVSNRELPVDGKYHWVNLKSYPFINNGRYQIYINSAADSVFGTYRQTAANTTAEIFISMKRTDTELYVDRAVIIPRSQKQFKLPKQFTGKKVVIFPWGNFNRANGAFSMHDAKGAWNGAAAISGAGKTRNKITEFGVYSPHSKKVLASTRIHSDNIRNENYRLIKIGTFNAANGIFFYAGANWALQFPFRWVSGKGTLYASVKFSGPQYIKTSKNPDALMIDYLLFVRE